MNSLAGYMRLSIGAAVATIFLKFLAFFVTGSVGLLSDALESLVNLAAAIFALIVLKIAAKPPDEDHSYGHNKVEYFSSIFEGVLIVFAALSIGYTAINRIIHPHAVDQPFIGIAISVAASAINLVIALKLIQNGRKLKSIVLEADGHHLLTDVWTSVGVIIGVVLVAVTNIQILDPIVAIAVAVNIIFTGIKLMRQSALGFMDTAIPDEEKAVIIKIIEKYCVNGIHYHALRSRQSGMRRFISFHLLVPENWTVKEGHAYVEKIEKEIMAAIPNLSVFTHLEALGDPSALEDVNIDR